MALHKYSHQPEKSLHDFLKPSELGQSVKANLVRAAVYLADVEELGSQILKRLYLRNWKVD